MPYKHQNVKHIPSIDPRLDELENCVECLVEDVATIKIGMGYKEKYNGEFKAEVETESQTMSNRLLALEQSNKEVVAILNTSITSMRWTIGIGFGGIISVLLLLISMHIIT